MMIMIRSVGCAAVGHQGTGLVKNTGFRAAIVVTVKFDPSVVLQVPVIEIVRYVELEDVRLFVNGLRRRSDVDAARFPLVQRGLIAFLKSYS